MAPPSRVLLALVNVLAAGVSNPFALLDIADCTGHLAIGGKKDAQYIANIVKPLITQMESELDIHNKRSPGIVVLVFLMETAMFRSLTLQAFNSAILMNLEFWKLLFVMCRALYAPMRVLCLSDQKTPAMDKLYYYVLQTDRMLPKYLDDAEKLSKNFLTSDNVFIMDRPSTAGLTSLTNDDNDGEDDDDDDYDIEADNVVGGGEEEVDSDDER